MAKYVVNNIGTFLFNGSGINQGRGRGGVGGLCSVELYNKSFRIYLIGQPLQRELPGLVVYDKNTVLRDGRLDVALAHRTSMSGERHYILSNEINQ
jgi:hypothetical protein